MGDILQGVDELCEILVDFADQAPTDPRLIPRHYRGSVIVVTPNLETDQGPRFQAVTDAPLQPLDHGDTAIAGLSFPHRKASQFHQEVLTMALTPYRAEPQPPYRWRLPHPQSKLQPLDLAAMEDLFEDLRDVGDLVADTDTAQYHRYPSR